MLREWVGGVDPEGVTRKNDGEYDHNALYKIIRKIIKILLALHDNETLSLTNWSCSQQKLKPW